MQFDGLERFREGFPTIQVVGAEQSIDLHNDADLREIVFDFENNELRIAWTVKQSAWTDLDHPETWQRRTVAGIVLTFSGIRSVSVSAGLLNAVREDDRVVEFLEYSRLEQGLGRMRIVFENGGDITLVASRCQLLMMNKV